MKKKILLYAGIVIGFLILSYAFVPQVLGGKIVNQSDISGWQGMAHEMLEWNSSHPDNQTAWTGSMFGGMPTTTIHASTKGDWTQAVYDILLTGKRPATYLFISLVGAFLLMLSLGISPLIAVGGAVAVTFCSYNFQIIQVGHNTKMQAIAFMPWVLAAVVFTYRKALSRKGGSLVSWLPMTALGAAGFGLFLSFQIKANHPQITYYLAILVLLYALVILIWMLRSRERRGLSGRFAAASGLLLVLGIAGIGTNAIKLLPTYEYTPYSMRGGSSDASSGSKGLELDYATAWSYGWEELPNMLIPDYNGGSSAGAVNPKRSETYALLKSAGQPDAKEICRNLPLYWGPQPFTAGPMYMGAITIFLFILGLMYYRGKEKWWIAVATLLAVFLALGSHFMGFTKFFYDFAPMYNKFRTVSMALVILQVTLPVLAFLMLDGMVKSPESASLFREKGWIALAVTGGFCLVCTVIPELAGDFSAASDAGQPDVLKDALMADRRTLLVGDALRSFILITASFVILLWGCRVPGSAAKTFATHPEMGMARRRTAALAVCFLVLLDLFAVGKRYLNDDHFISPRSFKEQFDKRPVDEEILKDTDPSYRVLDLTVSMFNDSHASYWHKSIGGYSPAKLQRYQEFIDRSLTGEIRSIFAAMDGVSTIEEAEAAMPYCKGLAEMNCRYFIIGDDLPPVRYRYAKGNAWFEAQDKSEAGSGTDEGAFFLSVATPSVPEPAADSIELTAYAPNELRYSYESADGGRVIFSEVYYPAGWTLTLDGGEELDIELYDDILRSAVVPAGKHELVMRFEPESYSTGEAVSRACSILLILLSLGSVAVALISKKKE